MGGGDHVIMMTLFSYLNFVIEGTKYLPNTGFPFGFLFCFTFWAVDLLVEICAVSS